MKAYSIVIKGNPISECGFKFLKASSEDMKNDFKVERFDAITPNNVGEKLRHHRLRWNWPWTGEELDLGLMIHKKAYKTKIPNARIGCFISHYELWHKSVELRENILVLEHDAIFIDKLDVDLLTSNINGGIIGINDPRGCTRKAGVFHDKIQYGKGEIQSCPSVDDDISIPQGLAGNSAYVISPEAAKTMIRLTYLHGAWPNDALMCKQLFPNLHVTKKYYTRVQGTRSTTTL